MAIRLVALLVLCGVARAEPRTLRVCADPNNLPFSNRAGQGYENELARLVATDLHAELAYMWLPQRRGFVRNTLGANRCDVMMEAPLGYGRAMTTRPYLRSSYVFVTRRDRHLDLRSLDDPRLKTLRIGVQVVGDDYANTPPAAALARRGLATQVRGYSVYGDYADSAPLSPIVDAVTRGDVDTALVWGPVAGYFTQKSAALELTSVEDDATEPGFVFDIGMGVRKKDQALREELDGVITRRSDDIANVLRRYGVPTTR